MDEDESNEYRLLLCNKCSQPFPAVVLEEHMELCKAFMELLSFDDELDFTAIADAAATWNAGDRVVPPDDDEIPEQTFCPICQRYISNLMIDQHMIMCQVLMDQYMEFENIKKSNLNDPSPDNKQEPELVENVMLKNNYKFVPEPIPEQPKKNDALPKKEPKVKCNDNFKIVPEPIPEQPKKNYSLPKEEPKIKIPEASKQNPTKSKEMHKVKEEVKNHNRMSDSVIDAKEQKLDEKKQGKTLSFGKDEEHTKDFMAEEQSFKLPNNPLLKCVDQTETEDLSCLSDDDCEENLEDFWRRARDFLKHRSMQNV